MLRTLASGLLDLLSPPECPGCALPWQPAVPGPEASAFCAACAPLIELPPPGLRPPAQVAAAVAFQGPLADAIRRLKYDRASFIAPQLGQLLKQAAQSYAGRVDAVVPLPLHPSKLRERGFNQAVLLARPVAASLGVPLRVAWLARRRATRNQAGLSSRERQQNVRGAFRARPVPAERVLLIDDVLTTGATLHEAAATLRTVGHEVLTLALAWTPSDRHDAPGEHEAL